MPNKHENESRFSIVALFPHEGVLCVIEKLFRNWTGNLRWPLFYKSRVEDGFWMDFPYCYLPGTYFSWYLNANLDKIMMLLLKIYLSDLITILHKSRELNCRDLVWPGWIFRLIITAKTIFIRFQLWAHNGFVKRVLATWSQWATCVHC